MLSFAQRIHRAGIWRLKMFKCESIACGTLGLVVPVLMLAVALQPAPLAASPIDADCTSVCAPVAKNTTGECQPAIA